MVIFILFIYFFSSPTLFLAFSETETYGAETVLVGNWGNAPGEFGLSQNKNSTPTAVTAIAVDREDNIYLLDSENYRIQIFTPDGKFQKVIEIPVSSVTIVLPPVATQFHSRRGKIEIPREMLIVDNKFSPEVSDEFNPGAAENNFVQNEYLLVDNYGNFYIAMWGKSDYIFLYENRTGKLVAKSDVWNRDKLSTFFKSPYFDCMGLTANGSLYVTDLQSGSRRSYLWTETGDFIALGAGRETPTGKRVMEDLTPARFAYATRVMVLNEQGYRIGILTLRIPSEYHTRIKPDKVKANFLGGDKDKNIYFLVTAEFKEPRWDNEILSYIYKYDLNNNFVCKTKITNIAVKFGESAQRYLTACPRGHFYELIWSLKKGVQVNRWSVHNVREEKKREKAVQVFFK